MGQPHHGHLCLPGSGHGAAHRILAAEEALWPQQAPHLTHHDEEHPGSCRLPAHHHLHSAVRW